MKWPWSRRILPVEVEPIPLRMSPITVNHIIERKPQPKPTRIWITFRNDNGEIWQGGPQSIYGQKVMLYPVPLSWITGKPDYGNAIQMELNLEYDG